MSDPLHKARQTALSIQSRLLQLDTEVRSIMRDESVRADVRQTRVQKLRADARSELRELQQHVRREVRNAAREATPAVGVHPHPDYLAGRAAQRALYSTRAQGMLAAGDLAGIRDTIRQAVRAGDHAVAQEYLTVAGHKLGREYGQAEVRQLQHAAMDNSTAKAHAIHKGLQHVADDDALYGDLQRHVDRALEKVGGGDPYDEGDPQIGRAVSLWSERVDRSAEEAGVKAADAQQADAAAVVD